MAASGDVAMWRMVLALGLHDHASGRDEGWLGSKDFRLVCALAGVEAEAVLSKCDMERFKRRPKRG